MQYERQPRRKEVDRPICRGQAAGRGWLLPVTALAGPKCSAWLHPPRQNQETGMAKTQRHGWRRDGAGTRTQCRTNARMRLCLPTWLIPAAAAVSASLLGRDQSCMVQRSELHMMFVEWHTGTPRASCPHQAGVGNAASSHHETAASCVSRGRALGPNKSPDAHIITCNCRSQGSQVDRCHPHTPCISHSAQRPQGL